jgi:hypothetical protein
MKENLIAGVILAGLLLMISFSDAISAPVGMENINKDHYSEPAVSCDNSSDPLACRRYENMSLNGFGDYSKWSQTYTFSSGNHLYDASDLLADMKIDTGVVLIEYAGNVREEPAPVPEPGTLSLIGLGLVSAGMVLRKRLSGKMTA